MDEKTVGVVFHQIIIITIIIVGHQRGHERSPISLSTPFVSRAEFNRDLEKLPPQR